MLTEFLGVNGGRGNDQLQVFAPGQQLVEVAEQEVDVQAALMSLVNDQGVVGTQVAVAPGLSQENSVGHELDPGCRAGAILKANLGTHHPGLAQLLLNSLGDRQGGNTAGLGAADHGPFRCPACIQTHLRQLGCLAGPGITGNNNDLVAFDSLDDFVLAVGDGQVAWVVELHGKEWYGVCAFVKKLFQTVTLPDSCGGCKKRLSRNEIKLEKKN